MSFGRYDPQEHQARREARKAANRAALCIPSRSGGTYSTKPSHASMPKGETARPGKRAPTVEERDWMDRIVMHGCVACRADGNGIVAPQVHHILRGGRRMGHLFTLPLCIDHHVDTGRPGFTARHPWKHRFEKLYGTEWELLDGLRAVLADSWKSTQRACL